MVSDYVFVAVYETTTETEINTETETETETDTETSTEVNKDNLHVAWEDFTDLNYGIDIDIFYQFWNAVSQSWSNTEVVSTESSTYSLYPSLAIDSKGNVHVAWEDSTDYLGSGTDKDIFYKFRYAKTQSWYDARVISTESTGYSFNPSLVIDSKNNVHVVWQQESHIEYRFRDGTSYSWGTTELVSTETSSLSVYPRLGIDSKDNARVVWRDDTDYMGSGADDDIFYKFRNTTSHNWSPTQVVSIESTADSDNPCLDIDSEDNIHVAWHDYTNYIGSGIEWDIFYKVGVNLDSLGQTVTNTETETETTTETVTGPTDTVTSTETSTVFGSDTLYETSTEVILTTSVITNAKSEVSWSLFFLIPVLIVPLMRRKMKRR